MKLKKIKLHQNAEKLSDAEMKTILGGHPDDVCNPWNRDHCSGTCPAENGPSYFLHDAKGHTIGIVDTIYMRSCESTGTYDGVVSCACQIYGTNYFLHATSCRIC